MRALLRNLPESVEARGDAEAILPSGPEFQVLFSRGIPDREEWKR